MTAAVPTDVVANDLAIRLFLFGLAAMSFYEAIKLERPRAHVAWCATALFALSGAALTPISQAWPMGVAWLNRLVVNPVTWFVLAMATYLILRPRWSRLDSSPAGEALATYDDAELRREIAGVSQSLAGLVASHQKLAQAQTAFALQLDEIRSEIDQQGEAEKSQLDELSAGLKSLKAVADHAVAKSKFMVAQEAISEWDTLIQKFEAGQLLMVPNAGTPLSRAVNAAKSTIALLDIPSEEVDRELGKVKDVRDDMASLVVQPEEAHRWKTGPEKREWLITRATMEAYRNIFKRNGPERMPHESSLLRNIRSAGNA